MKSFEEFLYPACALRQLPWPAGAVCKELLNCAQLPLFSRNAPGARVDNSNGTKLLVVVMINSHLLKKHCIKY